MKPKVPDGSQTGLRGLPCSVAPRVLPVEPVLLTWRHGREERCRDVVDADTGADPPWSASAYVPGPSLEAAVRRHGPLPERALGLSVSGLAEGLVAVHEREMVHRDLKPGNVLLAADGPG